jgi:hypothetical protein
MNNVVQLARDTRKSKDDKMLAGIADWSFAKKRRRNSSFMSPTF